VSEVRLIGPCPHIIGICGSIGSGKDTAAEALVQELGYIRTAFADQLKKWVAAGFPWVPECHFFGTQEEKSQTLWVANDIRWTGRKLLEHLGEAAREAYPDIWIKAVMEYIDRSAPWRWVIPDVRHPNEFHAIWDRGGVVWEVVKIGGPASESTGHVSDLAWRTIPTDAVLTARHGQVDLLKRLAVQLARSGGKGG
jgi:hypothetical protein